MRPIRTGTLVQIACAFVLLWRFVGLHRIVGPARAPTLAALDHPGGTFAPTFGWWSWTDQGRYVEDALAWSHAILAPGTHWYLPGYPLLGALFSRLTPTDPFLVVDATCLLLSMAAFSALSQRLLSEFPVPRALGALVFTASCMPYRAIWAWVVPWTSTPETACILLALLFAIRTTETSRATDAAATGALAVAIAAFRPADAAAIAAPIALFLAISPRATSPSLRTAGCVGGLACLAILAVAYTAIWGPHPSPYLLLSQKFGFEPRLIPHRWVSLMLDPQPLFPEGEGLVQVFPWLPCGLAGMIATLTATTGHARRLHALVLATAALDIAMLLAYRDLHPHGLWRYGNYHYFKWLLPIFGLYAARLPLLLALPGPRRLAATALTAIGTVLLLGWRTELDPVPNPHVTAPADPASITLPNGFAPLDTIVVQRYRGDPALLDPWSGTLAASGRTFRAPFDFKIYPYDDALRIVPLRPLPHASSTLTLPPGIQRDTSEPTIIARQRIRFGLPCWWRPDAPACAEPSTLPAPDLAIGQTIEPGRLSDRIFLVSGWSNREPDGRWTDGPRASIRFRLAPDRANRPLRILARLRAYGQTAPDRTVTVLVNGSPAARWHLGPTTTALSTSLPQMQTTTATTVTFVIAPLRHPTDHGVLEMRALGMFVAELRVVPEACGALPHAPPNAVRLDPICLR